MTPVNPLCSVTHIEHGFSLLRQRDVVYSDSETEGVGEEYGSVHWVNGTVPDVEQGGCVVEPQVA